MQFDDVRGTVQLLHYINLNLNLLSENNAKGGKAEIRVAEVRHSKHDRDVRACLRARSLHTTWRASSKRTLRQRKGRTTTLGATTARDSWVPVWLRRPLPRSF